MEQFEDLEQGRSFDLKKWKGLFPFLARYKKQFFTAMSFIIAISIVDIILPLFQRYAIDNFIEQGTTEGIWLFACTLSSLPCSAWAWSCSPAAPCSLR